MAGQIAGDMINGRVCALCGVYHEKGDTVWCQGNTTLKGQINLGYPVICDDCKND